MAIISVSQLKVGQMLIEKVQTELGGVLFPKHRTVSERDIEIMNAFLITTVSVNGEQPDDESSAKLKERLEEMKMNELSFHRQYYQMFVLLKHVFQQAAADNPIDYDSIRTQLEVMIKHSLHYRVLAFSPRNNDSSDYIFHNSIMVSLTSYYLAKWHGLKNNQLTSIALAGLLHNIGMAHIDPDIINKKSDLTLEELEEVKKHPVIGYNMLKSETTVNDRVKLAILQYQEREDGSGYPLGLGADKIHIYAKIIAIANTFHTLNSKRSDQAAASPYLVLEEVFQQSIGKLEPVLIRTFINKTTAFHNGIMVKLSNNNIGKIVFIDPMYPTRPWVNVNGRIINLMKDRSLFIQDVI